VVPFYDEHGIRLSRVLTDRRTEFCGSESHEYELYLAVEDIDHTRTKAKSPQTTDVIDKGFFAGSAVARRSGWKGSDNQDEKPSVAAQA
jgi:hypothetical protein